MRAIAAVQAAKLKIFYLKLASVQKNIFVDTADPELMGGTLERFGRVKLGRSPFPAQSGVYKVQVSGTSGSVIPANTTFKSNDNSSSPGKLFILDTAFTLGTTNQPSLRALEAGLDSKLSINDSLTVTGPVALVDSICVVVSEDTEPKAQENIEEYREKAIESYRLEPEGGAGSDYRLWSSEVQGVNQSYPYAAFGMSGVVDLYVEAIESDSTDGKGTPSTALLDDVKDSIELPTVDRPARRPLGATINYLPVSPKDIDIEISSFQGIDPSTETLIFNSIKSALEKVRPFVDSIDIVSARNDVFNVNNVISIILASKPGSVFGAVTMEVDGAPLPSFTFESGDIPYLNSVIYV